LLRLEGKGMAVDKAAAIEDLKRAAAQNHIGAMNLLGQAYVAGEAVEKDIPAGIALIEKTASFGNPAGLYAMGLAFAQGIGVEKDLVKSHAYFNLAATTGHPQGAQARAEIEAQLTPEQVIAAQRIARAFRSVPVPTPAP